MKNAFQTIFWGYFFVWLDFYIMIDLLPDPVGYFLIYAGVKRIASKFTIGKRVKNLSLVLVILSIPNVLGPASTGGNSFLQSYELFGWSWYSIAFVVIDLLLIFYTFQLILEVVRTHGSARLIKRSKNLFIAYFCTVFLFYLSTTFAMNLPNNLILSITMGLLVISFVMHILFLMLLLDVRRVNVLRINDLEMDESLKY